MKIVFVVYSSPEVGLGHWYRSLALKDEANRRGHLTWLAGNKMIHYGDFFQIRPNEYYDLFHVLHQVKPDYLVLDLQDRVPEYIYSLSKEFNTKVVVLNGVGRDWEQMADIVVIQGFSSLSGENIYSGIDYVILRDIIFDYTTTSSSKHWFVFGGARDRMGLLQKFSDYFGDKYAFLIDHKYSENNISIISGKHKLIYPQDEEMIKYMAKSKSACIAMGMTTWELAAMKIPTYVFSRGEGHLKFAKLMDEAGLIKAWDGIGIPEKDEMINFINTPFKPSGKIPTKGTGSKNIIDILEARL